MAQMGQMAKVCAGGAPFTGKSTELTEYLRRVSPRTAILRTDQTRSSHMARNHQSPLWNEDLVMAIALTFAGLMALEGKLFPAVSVLNSTIVDRLLNWKLLEFWPVLLII